MYSLAGKLTYDPNPLEKNIPSLSLKSILALKFLALKANFSESSNTLRLAVSALNHVELKEKKFEETSAKSNFIIPFPVKPTGFKSKFPCNLAF